MDSPKGMVASRTRMQQHLQLGGPSGGTVKLGCEGSHIASGSAFLALVLAASSSQYAFLVASSWASCSNLAVMSGANGRGEAVVELVMAEVANQEAVGANPRVSASSPATCGSANLHCATVQSAMMQTPMVCP